VSNQANGGSGSRPGAGGGGSYNGSGGGGANGIVTVNVQV
jgi:hypothetical protein